eukprot:Unigene6601_Nuclearia_a/m.20286 Unigene6601_Nuclearia_a/g.20286  ORF Unigene6601_Nuclearia_a/g.20286 Unigene6601_Nuclearia_a/m.20286 type:complete len:119 (-) Unigene6601_Nuclearia_a:1839-2195(-)
MSSSSSGDWSAPSHSDELPPSASTLTRTSDMAMADPSLPSTMFDRKTAPCGSLGAQAQSMSERENTCVATACGALNAPVVVERLVLDHRAVHPAAVVAPRRGHAGRHCRRGERRKRAR